MNRITLNYKTNWATIFEGSPAEIEEAIPQGVRSEPESDEPLVRIVRGKHCQSIPELMNEMAAVFQFPYYFGHNWDAFDECIQDLWWMKARSYLVVITDFDKLLDNNHNAKRTFLEIIKDASANWASTKNWPMSEFQTGGSVDFRWIFQVEGDKTKLTAEINDLV